MGIPSRGTNSAGSECACCRTLVDKNLVDSTERAGPGVLDWKLQRSHVACRRRQYSRQVTFKTRCRGLGGRFGTRLSTPVALIGLRSPDQYATYGEGRSASSSAVVRSARP